MSVSAGSDWQTEFGIDRRKVFFANKSELAASGANSSQSHVLRRAFDLLRLDGVLCAESTPLVYFKVVNKIDAAMAARLHRIFWNHGGAPILVLVAKEQVHVYSGFSRPSSQEEAGAGVPGLVETLDRTSTAIREFLPSVESGEFFRRHAKSFNPAHRVDRDLLDNLQATREKLAASSAGKLDTRILDALLCRLVFACYLFDREVVGEAYLRDIGLRDASHLREVLGIKPRTKAKQHLYDLFRKLGRDFNGDLFSDNLDGEERAVHAAHIEPLDDFFHATDVVSGQASFWPYDFAAIPIEAISAIYERFLRDSDKQEGAFYTPRFLAELVLDVALADMPSLLNRRYFDPACGSGIFLVGLFNRMAEEWRLQNPEARNDRRARELRKVLCGNLYGVDVNPTACRITAFSLYLAYLDQLTPRDIQDLHEGGHKLPTLVHDLDGAPGRKIEGNIWCGDFFASSQGYPTDIDLVIGNPPWGSTAADATPPARWCAESDARYPIPDKQMAAAFIWKAPHHAAESGRMCLVLPHGTLFNHSTTALDFQRTLLKLHAVDHVLNLADYQRFLFEEAGHPAVIISYRKKPPADLRHPIHYWSPKANWLVTRAEIITIDPEDRCTLTVGQVLDDLKGKDAPQIWKQRYWATPRDWRLIDRLGVYPRLRDYVRQTREPESQKRWVIAEGFQPLGENDDPAKAKPLQLPSHLFIDATSKCIDLFILPEDCRPLSSMNFDVRRTSNPLVFRAPHVLVAKGLTSIAFADFDVSFRHALRGITGPVEDRELLIFLAAYLRSSLARYFLFQTSSNWGVSRQEVHVEELLRLPFLIPDSTPNPRRAQDIVHQVAGVVSSAALQATQPFSDREALIHEASVSIETLINEYFDILPTEKVLIDDTVGVIIPSVRPTRKRLVVPTITPSSTQHLNDYTNRLCGTLNGWTKNGSVVQGSAQASANLGIAIAVLQKTSPSQAGPVAPPDFGNVLAALDRIRTAASKKLNTFELVRGTKVFDRDRLFVVKPIGQRFWTQTAALNDADEIAGTILLLTSERTAW